MLGWILNLDFAGGVPVSDPAPDYTKRPTVTLVIEQAVNFDADIGQEEDFVG